MGEAVYIALSPVSRVPPMHKNMGIRSHDRLGRRLPVIVTQAGRTSYGGDSFNVESSGSKIRGQEEVHFTLLKLFESL